MCSVLTVKALKWYNDLEMNFECVVVSSHLRAIEKFSCSVTKFEAEKARIRIQRTDEQILMCEKRKKKALIVKCWPMKSWKVGTSTFRFCPYVCERTRPLIQRTSIFLKAYIAYAIFKNIERIQAKL